MKAWLYDLWQMLMKDCYTDRNGLTWRLDWGRNEWFLINHYCSYEETYGL